MQSNAARLPGLIVLSASALVLLPAAAIAESSAESIGPWEIEATYKADRFDRCALSRKLDDEIVATFVRTGDGLTLVLESPNWVLERGENYPVTMRLGPQSFEREVAAEANSVSMDIADAKLVSGLSTASALDIVGAATTIHVPLDRSRLALVRLEQCVEKNEKAVVSNPFVAPARRP